MTERSIELRPTEPTDEELLRRVYGSTRAEELALVDWDDDQKRAFVASQFEAQRRHYEQSYPDATFQVIVVDGEDAGRLYVARGPDEIRIVDISLLPEYRNLGIGTALLGQLQAEGARAGRRVSIHVEQLNPARRLYERLGFATVADRGVYILMTWCPPAQAVTPG